MNRNEYLYSILAGLSEAAKGFTGTYYPARQQQLMTALEVLPRMEYYRTLRTSKTPTAQEPTIDVWDMLENAPEETKSYYRKGFGKSGEHIIEQVKPPDETKPPDIGELHKAMQEIPINVMKVAGKKPTLSNYISGVLTKDEAEKIFEQELERWNKDYEALEKAQVLLTYNIFENAIPKSKFLELYPQYRKYFAEPKTQKAPQTENVMPSFAPTPPAPPTYESLLNLMNNLNVPELRPLQKTKEKPKLSKEGEDYLKSILGE